MEMSLSAEVREVMAETLAAGGFPSVEAAAWEVSLTVAFCLIARWDNTAHWPEVETYPHHKHVGEEARVVPSEATTLEEVLAVIQANLRQQG